MKKLSIFIIITIMIISIFSVAAYAAENKWYKFTFTNDTDTIIDINGSNSDAIYGSFKLSIESDITYTIFQPMGADTIAVLTNEVDTYNIQNLSGFILYTTIEPGESDYFDLIGTFEAVEPEENNNNSIYQSSYDLIVNYVYGNAELTPEMTLTTVTMATIACVFCMALPFILVLKFINLIMGK